MCSTSLSQSLTRVVCVYCVPQPLCWIALVEYRKGCRYSRSQIQHTQSHTLTHTCPDPTLHQLLPNMPCYVRFAARAGAAAAGSLAFVPVRCELALPLHDVPLHADVCASMCASTSTGASAWSKATLEAHKSCLAELEAQLWEFMMPHVLPAQASAGAVSSLQQQVCLGAAPTPLHPVLFPGTGSAVVPCHADAK